MKTLSQCSVKFVFVEDLLRREFDWNFRVSRAQRKWTFLIKIFKTLELKMSYNVTIFTLNQWIAQMKLEHAEILKILETFIRQNLFLWALLTIVFQKMPLNHQTLNPPPAPRLKPAPPLPRRLSCNTSSLSVHGQIPESQKPHNKTLDEQLKSLGSERVQLCNPTNNKNIKEASIWCQLSIHWEVISRAGSSPRTPITTLISAWVIWMQQTRAKNTFDSSSSGWIKLKPVWYTNW